MACSPRHRWCGHVKAGDTRRKTAQIMLKWRACCLPPARRANGWRRRKPLIPRERRTAWRSCAEQRKHHEYFVSSQQTFPYPGTEELPVIRELVRSILTSVVVATVEDLNCGPLDQIFA